MELIFGILIIGGAAVFSWLYYESNKNENNELLQKIAKKYNFSLYDSKLSGTRKYNNIIIQFITKDKSKLLSIIVSPIKKTLGIELSKRGLIETIFDKKEKFTHDDEFDSNIVLNSNDKLRTLALLNCGIRRTIKSYIMFDPEFSITDNSIVYKTNNFGYNSIIDDIEELLMLSDHFTQNESIDDLLRTNILNLNNEYEYRIRCLEYLVEMPDSITSLHFYESLLNDNNNEIIFLAAKKLGKLGIPKMLELLRMNDYEYSKKILSFLKKYPDDDKVISAVIKTFESKSYKIITESIKYLNEINYNKMPEDIQFLSQDESLMENKTDLCREIILYFGRLKANDFIPFILKKINSGDNEIIIASIESLRLFDRIEFVEYILPFTKGFYSSEIKQKALKTIDYLQKNISKELKGTLSIADISSDEGNLSIDEDEENKGNLSLE
jgi:hypothetical protein